jgi:glycosyltransferase involved in cell wall biosynthesis
MNRDSALRGALERATVSPHTSIRPPPATLTEARRQTGPGINVSLSPTVSAVIPAKNEAKNLPWVLPRIPDLVDEVILVDGLSSDQTVEVAQLIRTDLVVLNERRPGKGAALRAGFERATGDYIVMFDADCSMDPLEIPRFIAMLDGGYDLVKGSRFIESGGTADMTLLRKAGNMGLLGLTNVLYGARYTDLCYGFMAFRRSLLGPMQLDAPGFEIEMQLVARATLVGARVAEVPSFEAQRMFGTSNLSTFRDGWRVLRTLLRERARRARKHDFVTLADG